MTYSEKLKDPRWQKKRLEILERDEWKCTGCLDTSNTLHVHHTYYEKGKEPWEAENHHLITLCKECHNIWHKFEKSNFYWEDIWVLNRSYNYHLNKYFEWCDKNIKIEPSKEGGF